MAVRLSEILFHLFTIFDSPRSSPRPFTTRSSSETVNAPPLIFQPFTPFSFCPRKNTGVYVTSIFAGAFAFSIGFDVGVTNFWDSWNRGVSRASS